MTELREVLKQAGCMKEEIEACVQAVTNISGDHLRLYQTINQLCKSQDDLAHTRSLIAQLGMNGSVTPGKRPYVRKAKDEPSLIDKSGAAAAMESLREQGPGELETINIIEKPKRQSRKRESDAEIKEAVDSLTGAVKLSTEKAAANLTIDL